MALRPEISRLQLAATLAAIVAVCALLARVGGDARWLAALGHVITLHGSVPSGVPFAAAPSGHWTNPLVLAELLFGGLERSLGDRGLMVAQLAAVAIGLSVAARDALGSGAAGPGTCAALLLVAAGALPALAIARVQLFSVALFPPLLLLLRSERRRPSVRLWLAVPLLALWSNLHGAALLGLLAVIVWAVLVRLRDRPLQATVLALAAACAVCLTPALLGTVSYYHGLVTNVAAQRGQGMWGALSLAPADVLLIACTLVLAGFAARGRPALWEAVLAAILAVLTVKAARNGIWLLLLLVAPAARAIRPKRTWPALAPAVAAGSAALLVFALVRGPVASGASRSAIARAVALARGSPVLASPELDEQVALAGGRIWIGNPIDAFPAPDQAAYLSWSDGDPAGTRALVAEVRVVLVAAGDRQALTLMARSPAFRQIGGDRTSVIYERWR